MPVQYATGATSLLDALDRLLDKGIVIHESEPVSLERSEVGTHDTRVVAAIHTSLGYPEPVAELAEPTDVADDATREDVLTTTKARAPDRRLSSRASTHTAAAHHLPRKPGRPRRKRRAK